MARVLKVNPLEPEAGPISEAARAIRNGQLVAFPTETVYGLGADALNARAVRRIFEVKRRPPDNPIIVHISELEQLRFVAEEVPAEAERLARKFWPGPLTLVLRRSERIPPEVSAGLHTVAVRMPAHRVALALIREAGTPIAAPSANLATRPSPTRAEHVLQDIGSEVELILDGGETPLGVESTVLSLVSEPPLLLRPGAVTLEELREELGRVELSEAARAERPFEGKAEAPGMKYRHYAPRAQLVVVEGEPGRVEEKLALLAKCALQEGRRVGVLATDQALPLCPEGVVIAALGDRRDPKALAHNLYQRLRELDSSGVEVIFAEGFPLEGLYLALANRLRKAAGYVIVRA
ncbi:MAG: threonylcarbamoyl-AMP synthase [Nitrososphaerota archaeon]